MTLRLVDSEIGAATINRGGVGDLELIRSTAANLCVREGAHLKVRAEEGSLGFVPAISCIPDYLELDLVRSNITELCMTADTHIKVKARDGSIMTFQDHPSCAPGSMDLDLDETSSVEEVGS
ncbi:MAG: hypothetical protein HC923_13375 [Myxococcales bacterium]|nr:hypothetical protein [Myxococcales bacterium]